MYTYFRGEILGYVSSIPEFKFSKNGVQRSKFFVQVKNPTGEFSSYRVSVTDPNVIEVVRRYVTDGSLIISHGYLTTNVWVDSQTGKEIRSHEFTATDVIAVQEVNNPAGQEDFDDSGDYNAQV